MTECTAFDDTGIVHFAVHLAVYEYSTFFDAQMNGIQQGTASQLELSLFQGQGRYVQQIRTIRPDAFVGACRYRLVAVIAARTNLDLNDIIRHPGIVFLFQYLYSALCPGHPFCKCLNRHHAHYHADCQHCTDQAFSYPFSHCTSLPFVFLYSHLNITLIALSSLQGSFLYKLYIFHSFPSTFIFPF